MVFSLNGPQALCQALTLIVVGHTGPSVLCYIDYFEVPAVTNPLVSQWLALSLSACPFSSRKHHCVSDTWCLWQLSGTTSNRVPRGTLQKARGCGWGPGGGCDIAVGFRGRESGGQRGGKEGRRWRGRWQVHKRCGETETRGVERDAWGALPGSLTSGKPVVLSSSVWLRKAAASSCVSVSCLSGAGDRIQHLPHVRQASELQSLSTLLASLLSSKVRCHALGAQQGASGWAAKFISGLVVGIALISLEHCLEYCLDLAQSLRWLSTE